MNILKFAVFGILLLLLGSFQSISFGQQGTISGKCIDQKGNPLEFVRIGVAGFNDRFELTDEKGLFKLVVVADQEIELIFRLSTTAERRQKITVKSGENREIEPIIFNVQNLEGVDAAGSNNQIPQGFSKLPPLDYQKFPNNSVERTLVYTTAASSNNELTSNYNVRGGNYDENLVYVNGFLINRPFLTRSGQQEGLSFINTALVSDVRFSGGGFDARFGDKLSSVLDIDYKTPDSLNASLMASLLGVEAHVAHSVNSRFNYLAGVRYRANGYLLNSLPTKGNYNPVFWDAQVMTNYSITEKLVWTNLVHLSSNSYRFAPETQQTDFGTVNEAYRLSIYFEGQEQTRFLTMTGASSLKWKPTKKTNLDLYASVFNTDEREYFDILGQYFINLLEKDPSKEEFGDSIATLGIGSYLNHARNRLNATIYNIYHNGQHTFNDKHKLLWGAGYQFDVFSDVLSEWKLVDSAGYSLPQTFTTSGDLQLNEVIKGKLELTNQRYNAYAQHVWEWKKVTNDFPVQLHEIKYDSLGKKVKVKMLDTLSTSYQRFILNTGLRSGYTTVNHEFYLTPRISFVYFPRHYFYRDGQILRRNTQLRISSGMFYQPPFYREFRTFDGKLNTSVRSQKSIHVVAGGDFNFNMWERDVPFKFSAEAFYKYMWDVNPYEVDNVRTRYYAENSAVAYAYGIDMNVHGEFVPGIQSFFKLGLLSTKEDVLTDSYNEYYNQSGEKIIFGFSEDQVVVDSATIYPGFIPRPTDQLLNLAVLFQDRMPGFERFSAQLGLLFNSRLPYGPPDFERYKDTLRQKSYFRVDLGLSYDFLYSKKSKETRFGRTFSDALISFEVFNLMGVNNVLSKQWIQDVEGKYYAIPNYLTQRRFNLKLILRF